MKRIIFTTVTLAIVWFILMEGFSLQIVVIGVILGIFISYISSKYIPNSKERDRDIKRIKFHKLITYPFWLIGQIYKDGFLRMKLVITGGKCSIVKKQLTLDSEVLCSIVAESITLTPGTICLELENKEITVLCISDKKTPGPSVVTKNLHNIEKRLQKAEGNDKATPD